MLSYLACSSQCPPYSILCYTTVADIFWTSSMWEAHKLARVRLGKTRPRQVAAVPSTSRASYHCAAHPRRDNRLHPRGPRDNVRVAGGRERRRVEHPRPPRRRPGDGLRVDGVRWRDLPRNHACERGAPTDGASTACDNAGDSLPSSPPIIHTRTLAGVDALRPLPPAAPHAGHQVGATRRSQRPPPVVRKDDLVCQWVEAPCLTPGCQAPPGRRFSCADYWPTYLSSPARGRRSRLAGQSFFV